MAYRLFGCAVALALAAQTGFAAAAELKVLTTPALSEVWHELAPKFEATGHKLTIVYAPSGAIAKRVTDGEAADLLVSTPAGIDGLIKSGKVTDGTNTVDRKLRHGRRGAQGRAEAGHFHARGLQARAARRQGGRLHGPGERRRQRRPHGEGAGPARHRGRGERAREARARRSGRQLRGEGRSGSGDPADARIAGRRRVSRWSGRCRATCRTSRRSRPESRQARRRPTPPRRWCVSCSRRSPPP